MILIHFMIELAKRPILVLFIPILGCTTNEKGNEKGKDCVFPFIYHQIKYDFCTNVDEEDYWCYTEVDKNGAGVEGKWGYCDANCFGKK